MMEDFIGWVIFLTVVVAVNWWAVVQTRDARDLKKRGIRIPHPAGFAVAGAVFMDICLGVAAAAALVGISQR